MFISTIGLYVIGRLIYMHSAYYTNFDIVTIIILFLMLIVLLGLILNTIGYLTNFKKSDYKNTNVLIIGIIVFVGMSYNWSTEIKESEYNDINSFYKEIKENPEVEKLFTMKFNKFKIDNLITRSEYFELKRIRQYCFYKKNKSIQKSTRKLILER